MIDRHNYVIVGYDLTEYRTDKYEDWKWTEEGEGYNCYPNKGEIQFFDDPMSGSHLYFGYILADVDEYEMGYFDLSDFEKHYDNVTTELKKLKDIGIVSIDKNFEYKPKVMVFVECS